MARKVPSLGRFGCPSPALMVPPSARSDEIARLMRRASLLAGVLAATIGANALLVPLAIARADVTPYVVDGGLFGCQATVVREERP